MAIADLKLGTIILPRSDSPKAISRLTEFEWFHKIESENDTVTPEIDDLLLEAQKSYQAIDDVVKGLQIPREVGMMEIMFKGMVIKKKHYELDEIETLIEYLNKETPAVIDRPAKLLEEDAEIKRSLDEYNSLKATIEIVKKLDIDLTDFGLMKYFYTNLFVIKTSDYDELTRSLDGVTIYKYDIGSKEESAIILIADASDADKVLKVTRSFNINPFVIPQGFSQIPSQAYASAESKIKELTQKQKNVTKEIAKITKSLRGDILALHEKANIAKEVLESLRKPGGTRSFALIQGYIPSKMESKFKNVTKQWMSIVEDVKDSGVLSDIPTLFDNKRWVRTFEVITQSQGIPKRGEVDPTPMIALMWPIFYGIMFADVGHGLLLMGMGLLFKVKGQGILSKWGMLIAISGASAAVAGVGAGEAFGFHLDHLAPFEALLDEGGPLHSVSWLVGAITVAELTFDQVIGILKVSIFLGVLHLVGAFILHIRKLKK